MSLRSNLSSTLYPQKRHLTHTHLVRLTPLTVVRSTVSAAFNRCSAFHLRIVQREQTRSHKSLRLHFNSNSIPKKKLTLAHIVRSTTPTDSFCTLHKATDSLLFSLRIVQTEQTSSDKSSRLDLISALYSQKQNLSLSHLFRPTSRPRSRSTVRKSL